MCIVLNGVVNRRRIRSTSATSVPSRLLWRARRRTRRPTRRRRSIGFVVFGVVDRTEGRFDSGDRDNLMWATRNSEPEIVFISADDAERANVGRRQCRLDASASDENVCAGVEMLWEVHLWPAMCGGLSGKHSGDFKSQVSQC